MTTAADDSAVEDAFEALLAGRPAPHGASGLAAFTEAVRDSATSPGRPNAALSELLATGLLVDQSSPSAATARSAGAPSGARDRIRRRTAMFIPGLFAKLLSAGAVAQAATGAAVVVVAFAGAGAAGVLPDPVQDTFTSVVSDETEQQPLQGELPVEEPPAEDVPAEEGPVAELPVAQVPVPADQPAAVDPLSDDNPWTDESEWAMNGPLDGHPFGDWVSYGREQGWGDGALVSCWAHHRNDERKGRPEVTQCPPTAPAVDTGEEPAADGGDDGVDDTEATDDGDRRGNGRGHGNHDTNRSGRGHGGDRD